MGWYIGFSGQIPIDMSRDGGVEEAFMRCRESLEQGISLVIFPEGTRSEDCQLARFRTGAFRLAKDTGVPVLPVSIFGTHKLMKKGTFLPQSLYHPIRCRVLSPISGEGLSTARKLKNRVREAISTNLDELRANA
jgi:1-acyl-sn-glycerol-3-phosphate acyltransferase